MFLYKNIFRIYRHLSLMQCVILLAVSLGITLLFVTDSDPAKQQILPQPLIMQSHSLDFTAVNPQEIKAPIELQTDTQGKLYYVVSKGDTLSSIFFKFHVSQLSLLKLLEADLNVLALDTIQPGHKIEFRFDNKRRLTHFIFRSGLAHRVIFKRASKDDFEFTEVIEPGEMKRFFFSALVQDNFHNSIQAQGVNKSESHNLSNLINSRINMRRDVRSGDEFQLVLVRQYIKGQYTGSTKIEAFKYVGQRRQLNLYGFADGFFDQEGRSLEKVFQRIPLKKNYRISSSFNPRRLHPVTKAVRPHNGTDFATPIGTPVVAAADGVVTRVLRHAYAGLYIELQHGRKYRTRYLHLSRAYVRKGQTVSRGQKIALTGNTGRTTGAHLHYEFHINKQPVNAMRAKMPEVKRILAKNKSQFKVRKAELDKMLKDFSENNIEPNHLELTQVDKTEGEQ